MTTYANPHRILVLGGGYAGVLSALRIAGRSRGTGAQITLVSAAERFVERIRLHEAAVGRSAERDPIPHLLRGTGVAFVQARVTAVDPSALTVTVERQGAKESLGYDTLVYALGSTIDTETVPGADRYTFTLSSPAAAAALYEAARREAARGGRLVVAGGGLTGIEAAAELAEAFPGLRVSLVTRERFGEAFSARGRAYLLQTFSQLGIEIIDETTIERVEPSALALAGGGSLPFDACLWAGSFRAQPLLRQAGLKVNDRGQALVDPFLRSLSHPEIFVVGDAGIPATDPGAPIRMGCATAEPMGAHAADNVARLLRGEPLQPFRFNYITWCVSLGRRRGLVQLVHGNDRPKATIISGRFGAMIKETICRFAYLALGWERRWPGAYTWLKSKHAEPAGGTIQPVRA